MGGRFQILSLDGGGIKGIFSAAVLAAIEDDLGTTIVNHFDLVVGTSTGGIIALSLGIGMSPREIVEFYVQEGPKIFPQSFRTSGRLFTRKYGSEPLASALKACFGERRLADSQKRLAIPSYNLDADEVYIFKTAHHTRFQRDYKVPMWKIALATSSAPTYFGVCREVDSIRLIDGGVWANNPVVVGIVEAIGILQQPVESLRAFSLSTTSPIQKKPESLSNGGFWQWRKAAVDVILRGQSVGAHGQASLLLDKDRYLRCDPLVHDELFALDKLTAEGLLSNAAHTSRHLTPEFKRMFSAHMASPFVPCHTITPVSGEVK
ncbi:MAG TPA: CBASS cGAMP-activated phospholipase [candidate division Zixibacteria bacterium]|nr:patatin-like phospholipase family protein [candidate division Zixibacteria bacterium]MDD4918012.1 CBASS cGAMP-activated phospholipase [candidate division Zixibacteria bacterium]MDM7972436.1 CBASS cGAMP-activated phospholipase [candidate division Zixibacteria bacterium]HPM38251.1 CBASS cGAMP-activated phospholipase [candidate division Zixibacteria bacterium]